MFLLAAGDAEQHLWRSQELRGSSELQNGGLRALEAAWATFSACEAFPGHLALLERVFLVLDGAAPSLFQLCGVFPYMLEIWRGSGSGGR